MSELSERDMRILAFERRGWRSPGVKEQAIAEVLDMPGHPVLPAAERADRPARGARLRPGARQAAAGPASPSAAHALAAPEGAVSVTLPPAGPPNPRQKIILTERSGLHAPAQDLSEAS